MAGECFTIGILDDFSGGRGEGLAGGFRDVDRDDFEALLGQLEPQLSLDLPFASVALTLSLTLSDWEHFHPDSLVLRVPALTALLDARDRVDDPVALRGLLREAGDSDPGSEAGAAGAARAPAPAEPGEAVSEAGLLDAMLDDSPSEAPVQLRRPSADPSFDRLIAAVVGDAADHTNRAAQADWRATLDAELSARVCAVLHHEAFRRLEATWRSLFNLVRACETGPGMRLRVLDVPRRALGPDEASGAALLRERIVERERESLGGDPFDLLVCGFAFGADASDVAALTLLGDLAAAAEAPLLAGAGRSLLAAAVDRGGDPGAAWRAFRASDAGAFTAVCGPSVLLRVPYGADEPAERFDLDEVAGARGRDPHLWGSAAWTVAAAAARAVSSDGSATALPRHAQLADLPFHVVREDGEPRAYGPTEQLLSDPEVDRLIENGLLPIAGRRGGDEAQIRSVRSAAGRPLFR